MPNINQIQVGTTTYDIQDNIARENIKSLSTSLSTMAFQPDAPSDDKEYARKNGAWAEASGGGTWGSITGTLSDQTDLQNALEDKTDLVLIAEKFDDEVAYAIGDLVIHDGNLYRYTSAHAAGSWDTSEVTAVTVSGELSGLKTLLGTKADASALANYLPLSGETMTGTIKLHTTDGLEFPNEAGFTTDQYGNFKHKRDTANDSWGLINNAGTSQFTVQWESGTVTKGIWNGTAIDLSHGGTGGTSLAGALANLVVTVPDTSTSINSLTTPGIYYVNGNTGIPEGTNGILIVIGLNRSGSGIDYYKQIFIRYGTAGSNDGNIYHRRISSSNGANVKWWKITGTLVS